jgi:DNA-binding transcriptional MerR regulator
MNKLSIGKMAEFNQVSVQTLRYYDKIGVLIPKYIDEKTRYRYYDISQSARLNMIKYMKTIDIPLVRLKKLLDKRDLDQIFYTLSEQSEKLDSKIAELIKIKSAVEAYIKNYFIYTQTPLDTVIKEQLPQRKIFSYTENVNLDIRDYSFIESIISRFRQTLDKNKVPVDYSFDVGTIIRQKFIDRIEEGQLINSEIFVFVDENVENRDNIEIVPESDYLCLYFDDHLKGTESAQKLLKFTKDNHYRIQGDLLWEVIANFPMLNDTPLNIFSKIQIPVK